MEHQHTNRIIWTFFKESQVTIALALLMSLGVSLSQLLLPLTLGLYFEVGMPPTSSKGTILYHYGITFVNYQSFFIGLFGLVVLRGLFGFGQKYFFLRLETAVENRQKSLLFHQFLFEANPNDSRRKVDALSGFQSRAVELVKWPTEGLIRPVADWVYLLFVAKMLAMISPLLASIFFSVILLFSLIVHLLGRSLIKRTRAWGKRRREVFYFVNEWAKELFSIRSLNREKLVFANFTKKWRTQERSKSKLFALESLVAAAAPVGFFAAMASVLFCDSYFQLHTESSPFLVFILLTLYLQSAIKRLFNVPFRWTRARLALKKISTNWGPISEREPKELRTNQATSLMMIDDPIFSVSFDQPVPFTIHFNEWKVIRFRQSQHVKEFLEKLIRLNEQEALNGELFDLAFSEWSGFQIRKQITFLGPDYPLDGDTVQEALCYSKNESKRAQMDELMAQFHWDFAGLNSKTAIHELQTESDDYHRLQAIRAILTNKKLLILNRYFDSISVPCEEELRAFFLSYKNRSIIEFQK
jgi:hypothetical protein